MNDILLPYLFYMLCFGAGIAAFCLKLVFYLRQKARWKLNLLFFIAFMILLIVVAISEDIIKRFYGPDGNILSTVLFILESVFYSLMLVNVPYVISTVIGYRVMKLRTAVYISAAVVFFGLYTASGFSSNRLAFIIPAKTLMFTVMLWILLDGFKKTRFISDRHLLAVMRIVFAVTMVFLPFITLEKIIDFKRSIPFFTVYIFYLALVDIIFLVRFLSSDRPAVFSLKDTDPASFEALGLTAREREVVLEIEKGLTCKEIAFSLGISPNTVNNHIASIYRKCGAGTRVELIRILREALVNPAEKPRF